MLRNRDSGHVAIAFNRGDGKFDWNGGFRDELTGIGEGSAWTPIVGEFGPVVP